MNLYCAEPTSLLSVLAGWPTHFLCFRVPNKQWAHTERQTNAVGNIFYLFTSKFQCMNRNYVNKCVHKYDGGGCSTSKDIQWTKQAIFRAAFLSAFVSFLNVIFRFSHIKYKQTEKNRAKQREIDSLISSH